MTVAAVCEVVMDRQQLPLTRVICSSRQNADHVRNSLTTLTTVIVNVTSNRNSRVRVC